MSTPLLKVENLKTAFAGGGVTVRAVDGVSFEIARGETLALLGESGCGKSMTALSIMRLVPEPAGRIMGGAVRLHSLSHNNDLLALPEVAMRDVRGKRIGMIFQEPMTSLNPVLTVGQQIEESLVRHLGLRGEAARKRVVELLDSVGIPDPARRYTEYPHQLSGGMKQRVMIAMALAGEPELLIADEPTTALDVTIQAQVLELMRQLQKDTGMAILLITHDLGVVAEMADRVAVMYAGQIVETADRDEFFRAPKHPYSQKLFQSLPGMDKRDRRLAVIRGSVPSLATEFRGCRFTPRCDFAWQTCHDVVPNWSPLDCGAQPSGAQPGGVLCHLYDEAVQKGEPEHKAEVTASPESRATRTATEEAVLRVEAMQVFFPVRKGLFQRAAQNVRAVDGIDLHIPAGRTVALVGESGCGKTTVGKGILQLIRPTGGRVRFDGVELTAMSMRQLRPHRADIQIIFQDPFSSMNPRMRVGSIIEEGMITQGKGGNAQARAARVDELLRQVGLSPEVKQRYPHEFSGGQRQRICIARALAVEPKLIICDEPTSALDVSVQAQILNLLKDLQDQLGLAYLFITHNLSVVEYLAHEVAVMYLGRIVEQGTVEDVMRNAKHPYTHALLAAVPSLDPESRREVKPVQGEMPSPVNPPTGCHFHPRCPHVMPRCRVEYPGVSTFGDVHTARCFLYPQPTGSGHCF